jgi:hypothetical protein
MPLVGYRTKLPPNRDLQEIINKIMAEDKIEFRHFEQQAQIDATSSWGSYRKIVGKATDIVYDIVQF